MKLAVGMRIRITRDDPEVWEVVRVGISSATIRSTRRERTTFETASGDEVEFSRAGRKRQVAVDSSVFLAEEE